MTRKFTAAALAFMLAITSVAALPAKAASESDVAKIVVGALTLAIIAKAIKNNENKSTAASRAANSYGTNNYGTGNYRSGSNYRYDDDYRYKNDKHYDKKYKKNAFELPAQCYFEARHGNNRKGFFGSDCLDRSFARASRLPYVCEDTVRGRANRKIQVYDAACLRKFGYRVEARR